MKVTVYGPGCPKCQKVEEVARQAIAQAGVNADLIKIKDPTKMAEAGVLMTPALAIDGKVVVSGKIPSVAEVVTHIMNAAAK